MSNLCPTCIMLVKNRFDGYLHRQFAKLLECSRSCKFCAYICSILGDKEISRIKEKAMDSPYCWARLLPRPQTSHIPLALVDIDVRVSWKSGFTERRVSVCADPAKLVSRSFWSCETLLTLRERIPTIQQWISECSTNHQQCNALYDHDAEHAARFLDLHAHGHDVRLISGLNVASHKEPYAALSHCWGGAEIPSKLTRAKLQQYEVEILYDALPRTFQEAIDVARALNFRFLWVDSLCIVQDDPQDWQIEADKMMSVFRGAKLTISASAARNADERCGILDALPPACHFQISGRADSTSSETFVARISAPVDVEEQFESLPVHLRGWIFQEKMLSQRILHLLRDEFVFQCHELIESESGRHSETYSDGYDKEWQPLGPVCPGNRHLCSYDAANLWRRWIMGYTKRSLTYQTDVTAAFAGMVRFHRELFGGEPVLGLWRDDLVFALTWEADSADRILEGREHKTLPPKFVACRLGNLPSWTWMSLPFPLVRPYHTESLVPKDKVARAEIHDVQISWSGPPLSSWPTRGALTIVGRFYEIWWGTKHTPGRWISKAVPVGHSNNPDLEGRVFLDQPELQSQRGKSYERFDALALWSGNAITSWSRNKRSVTRVYSLILQSGDAEAEYRRVGMAILDFCGGKDEFHDLGEMKMITLV